MADPDRPVYLFGFTELGGLALPDGPLGVPHFDELDGGGRAIVSQPPDTWSDDQLEEVEWIAPRAIHHDAVLRATVDANVVPLRFGSLFADEASYRAAMRPMVDRLPTLFDELRGRHEYRVSVRPRAGRESAATSGAEYLRRRQRALTVEQRAGDTLLTLATEYADLAQAANMRSGDAAVDVLAEPTQLDALVAALTDADLDAVVDGPLPPYHAVTLAGEAR